jgi:hypothetical protein
MILSTKPMPPLELPSPCGVCSEPIVMPRRVRHIIRQRWRYRLEQLQYAPGEWGGVKIVDAYYFQPHHRRAIRYWRDTRPHRRRTFVRRHLTRR